MRKWNWWSRVRRCSEELVEDLDGIVNEDELGDPFLSSHNYRAYPLSVKCFKPIKNVDSAGNSPSLMAGMKYSSRLLTFRYN